MKKNDDKIAQELLAAACALGTRRSIQEKGELSDRAVKTILGLSNSILCLKGFKDPSGANAACTNCNVKEEAGKREAYYCLLSKDNKRRVIQIGTAELFLGYLVLTGKSVEKSVKVNDMLLNFLSILSISIENLKGHKLLQEINNTLQLKITESREIQRELKELTNKFKAIIAAIPDLIFEIDMEGRIFDYSAPRHELLYMPPENFLGKRMSEVLPDEVVDIVFKSVSFAIEQGYHQGLIYSIDLPSGRRWFELSMTVKPETRAPNLRFIALAHDITGRKIAEDALENYMQILQIIIDTMPNPVYYKDINLVYRGCNRAFEALINKNKIDFLGKLNSEIFSKEFLETYPLIDKDLLENPGVQIYESQIMDQQGMLRNVIVNKATYKIKNVVSGIVGVIQDITGLKQVEEALRQSEEQYRELVENITDVIFKLDLNGIITYISPAIERISAYHIDEITGKPISDFIYPDDLSGIRDIISSSISEPINFYDFRVLDKDKSVRYFRSSIRHTMKNGAVTGFNGAMIDITERKRIDQELIESRKKYQAFVEKINDVIFAIDSSGMILYISPSVNKITKRRQEEYIGKNMLKFIFNEDREITINRFQLITGGNGVVMPLEYRMIDNDGSLIWVRSSVNVERSENNAIASITGVISDITARRKAEEEITKLNEDLEQRVLERTAELSAANQELENFAYSASHDLRSPLRGIDGWSLALLEDYAGRLDEKGRGYLDTVRSEAQRMGRLIDAMLQMLGLFQCEMNREKVDLTGLALSVEKELRLEQPGRDAEFIIQPEMTTEGDERLIRIMLKNLLGNSWKFTDKCERAKIEFGVNRSGQIQVFFIRDNGVGFDMDYASKLFVPFQRLHTVEEYQGTGIGLATVQRIINRHGGSIWAEGQISRGATFYFII